MPNKNQEKCLPIRPVYLEWSSPWAIIPAVYSTCGILLTLFVASVFIRFNDTPVVMASGNFITQVKKHEIFQVENFVTPCYLE